MLFNYKTKNSLKSPFIVSYAVKFSSKIVYKALSLWIAQLRLNPGLNFLNLQLDVISRKMFFKYEASNIFIFGSKEDKMKWCQQIAAETKSLIEWNRLLYFSLLFKYMRPIFVRNYWDLQLIKLDGRQFIYNLSDANSKVTKEGHMISWEIKELDLRFIAISSKDKFEIQPNKELREKVKSLGVLCLTLKLKDEVIDILLVEYLRFLFFPLCIDLIQKENKNK